MSLGTSALFYSPLWARMDLVKYQDWVPRLVPRICFRLDVQDLGWAPRAGVFLANHRGCPPCHGITPGVLGVA